MHPTDLMLVRQHQADLLREARTAALAAEARRGRSRVATPVTVLAEAGAVARGTRAALRVVASRVRSLGATPSVDDQVRCA